MKKIGIILYGPESSGKSTVLNSFINELIALKEIEILSEEEDEEGDRFIICRMNNKKLGIETLGDPESRFPTTINTMIDEECDIVICAMRTEDDYEEELRASVNQLIDAPAPYTLVWKSNYRSTDTDLHDSLNHQCRINLRSMLFGFINSNNL